jgi:ribonucleoside-triphosphate reductase
VLNRRAGQLLTAMDIHDIETWLGTILSSRRSAEISLYEFDGPEWKDFALAKKDSYLDPERKHREMANNSLLFTHKPSRRQLTGVFKLITEGGGSEPGFINAAAAIKRAPYFRGVNPCAEILLGDKSFCNLVETVLCRFNGDEDALWRAHRIVARANYRQTCVNLDDGILQRTWHELNQFLRLCGVGVTGVIGWEHADDKEAWQDLRSAAHAGANGMADELGLPRPQLVTTVKPSGTQSKASGHVNDEVPEGVHKPLGRFIFNNVVFPAKDPLVNALIDAGYQVTPKQGDSTAVVVKFPVEYNNIEFDKVMRKLGTGHSEHEVEVEVNLESAVDQLDRYKLLMDNYVDHNCSITVSYSPEEIPEIIDWLMSNWDSYVGVSWLYRNDPSVTAADLGFPYLPQEVVDAETFRSYERGLAPVKFRGTDVDEMLDLDDCSSGACPIR